MYGKSARQLSLSVMKVQSEEIAENSRFGTGFFTAKILVMPYPKLQKATTQSLIRNIESKKPLNVQQNRLSEKEKRQKIEGRSKTETLSFS